MACATKVLKSSSAHLDHSVLSITFAVLEKKIIGVALESSACGSSGRNQPQAAFIPDLHSLVATHSQWLPSLQFCLAAAFSRVRLHIHVVKPCPKTKVPMSCCSWCPFFLSHSQSTPYSAVVGAHFSCPFPVVPFCYPVFFPAECSSSSMLSTFQTSHPAKCRTVVVLSFACSSPGNIQRHAEGSRLSRLHLQVTQNRLCPWWCHS